MANLQTAEVVTEEKETTTKASCPEKKQTSNPLRLLVGKLVFLDLTVTYKPINKIKECLSLIEAVNSFFFKSKFIFYRFNIEINLSESRIVLVKKWTTLSRIGSWPIRPRLIPARK